MVIAHLAMKQPHFAGFPCRLGAFSNGMLRPFICPCSARIASARALAEACGLIGA